MYNEKDAVEQMSQLGLMKPSQLAKYLTGSSLMEALDIEDQGFHPFGLLFFKYTEKGLEVTNEESGMFGDKMFFKGNYDLQEAIYIFKNNPEINFGTKNKLN